MLLPAAPGVLCAMGCALADVRHDFSQTVERVLPRGEERSDGSLQPAELDAILTDESMPDLSGTELAYRIRQLRASIPIILMTGHASVEMSQRGTQIGIGEILLKPLHGRDLAESLARVFGSVSL